MKILFKIIFFGFIGFGTLGCAEDDLSDQTFTEAATDIQAYENLEFTYRIIDMEGNSKSTFPEGADFNFSFKVRNSGENDYFLGPWLDIPTKDNFFAIYKEGNIKNEKQRIGKSYRLSGNYLDLRPQIVPANGEIEYRMPWLTQSDSIYVMPQYDGDFEELKRNYQATDPEPNPLPTGNYYSSFSLEYKGKVPNFEVAFSVE